MREAQQVQSASTHHDENWSSPILAAYRASLEEHVWLKPATWIAGASLIFVLASSVFFWGKSSSQNVTQEQLKKAVVDIPTRKEMQSELKNKASSEDVLKLKGSMDLLKQEVDNMKSRQNQGFIEVNRRLDIILQNQFIRNKKNE